MLGNQKCGLGPKFGRGPLWRRRPALGYCANEEEEENYVIFNSGENIG